MKRILVIALALGVMRPVLLHCTPEETLHELARVAHNTSPTQEQKAEVVCWHKQLQQCPWLISELCVQFMNQFLPALIAQRDARAGVPGMEAAYAFLDAGINELYRLLSLAHQQLSTKMIPPTPANSPPPN